MSQGLAVITGATGGIGAATCKRLCEAGFAILAHYRSESGRAEALRDHIEARGGACRLVAADLASPEGVDTITQVVDEILESGASDYLAALVNNAGILLGPSFQEATVEGFDRYMAINVRAPFFLSQALCQRMVNGASIVNISSAGAHFSSPGDIVYAMSKTALESLTFNMAEFVAKRGIRVNSIVPGFTDNGHEAFRVPQVREYMDSFAVLGGVSQPETVAEAVEFLVSDRSCRTTGSIVDVSGGSLLGARGDRQHGVRSLIPDFAVDKRGTSQSIQDEEVM